MSNSRRQASPQMRTFTAHLPLHRQLLEDKPDKDHIRRAKQLLDFFTIGCFSGIQISNQKSIIKLLEATIEYLRREYAVEQMSTLSTSFLSCLTAFQRGQPGIKVCDAPLLSDPEIIWQVGLGSATPDLTLACKSWILTALQSSYIFRAASFALHVISSHRLPEPLTQVEAWDFLREAFLLLASQDYLGDGSALALVVSPSICNALSHLLRCADEHTGAHVSQSHSIKHSFRGCDPLAVVMQSSPWTSYLHSMLRRIQGSEDHFTEDYPSLLKARIAKPATDLMNQVGP
jgi:hypothetical protein